MKRTILISLTVLLAVVMLGSVAIYAVSERKLHHAYPVDESRLALSLDGASVVRGAHLVKAIGACTLCHGDDLGGSVYADMGPIGYVAGPNLTRGRGGAGARNSTADFVRAIRYGVRQDGTSLIAMPSEVYTNMNDADLASIIAYLKAIPPVDREMPRSHFKPLGRALLATGRLNILVAPKTRHPGQPVSVPAIASAEYGKYIADVSGCHGCHGYGLSGGVVAGPPGLPPAANLTPTGIGAWSEADFVRAMRQGQRPDGTKINEFMPWKQYGAMSDDELRAIWLYLGSVPAKASGNK